MDLRHLRYFVAVAEALSFTRGAEKLHLAQPSLTRQIKNLEEEIGVRLLDRTTQQVKLTPEAAKIVTSDGVSAPVVTDGPFPEAKEQIGGICIITAADLDEALTWGAKLSRATTTPVEVRPLQSH